MKTAIHKKAHYKFETEDRNGRTMIVRLIKTFGSTGWTEFIEVSTVNPDRSVDITLDRSDAFGPFTRRKTERGVRFSLTARTAIALADAS